MEWYHTFFLISMYYSAPVLFEWYSTRNSTNWHVDAFPSGWEWLCLMFICQRFALFYRMMTRIKSTIPTITSLLELNWYWMGNLLTGRCQNSGRKMTFVGDLHFSYCDLPLYSWVGHHPKKWYVYIHVIYVCLYILILITCPKPSVDP